MSYPLTQLLPDVLTIVGDLTIQAIHKEMHLACTQHWVSQLAARNQSSWNIRVLHVSALSLSNRWVDRTVYQNRSMNGCHDKQLSQGSYKAPTFDLEKTQTSTVYIRFGAWLTQ